MEGFYRTLVSLILKWLDNSVVGTVKAGRFSLQYLNQSEAGNKLMREKCDYIKFYLECNVANRVLFYIFSEKEKKF